MELKKHPETEMEYWAAIEGLGRYIQSTRHGLFRDHIQDPDGKVAASISEAQALSRLLVDELKLKFHVIPPKDLPQVAPDEKRPPAPEGQIYYWDWYEKMKDESYRLEYDELICTACPFSLGADEMVRRHAIPCSAIVGRTVKALLDPYYCAALSMGPRWDGETLKVKIVEKVGKGGETAWAAFLQRRQELIAKEDERRKTSTR